MKEVYVPIEQRLLQLPVSELQQLIIYILKNILSGKERKEIFNCFCRGCGEWIDNFDWSGANYCCSCSPDPNSR